MIQYENLFPFSWLPNIFCFIQKGTMVTPNVFGIHKQLQNIFFGGMHKEIEIE